MDLSKIIKKLEENGYTVESNTSNDNFHVYSSEGIRITDMYGLNINALYKYSMVCDKLTIGVNVKVNMHDCKVKSPEHYKHNIEYIGEICTVSSIGMYLQYEPTDTWDLCINTVKCKDGSILCIADGDFEILEVK